MKKVYVFLLAMFLCMNAFAERFHSIVFLGDSLSDNGNLYKLLAKIIPKSPPYYHGRFSNGPTWAENVGNYYSSNKKQNYKIYAYGGATAILHEPSIRFIAPTNLELELSNYFFDSLLQSKKNVLFAIWIGSNDYLFDTTNDMEGMTSKVIDKISFTITELIRNGARNFLILNLPDLSVTPFAKNYQIEPRLRLLALMHNQKLEQKIIELKIKYPDVKFDFMNIYNVMQNFIEHPDIYNKKYNVNVKNTTTSCWQGGYTRRHAADKIIDADSRASLMNEQKNYDIDAVNDFIAGSPELSYTYSMSTLFKRGILPCSNPDEYLFWDEMHPTAVVHQVLSEIIIENLNQYFT